MFVCAQNVGEIFPQAAYGTAEGTPQGNRYGDARMCQPRFTLHEDHHQW